MNSEWVTVSTVVLLTVAPDLIWTLWNGDTRECITYMLYDNLKWCQKGRQAMKKIVKLSVSPEYLRTPKYQRIPKIRSHILLTQNAVREVVKTIVHRQDPHWSTEKKLVRSFSTPLSVGACVAAELLTPRTLDLEVRGLSLACHVVSLDKELYSALYVFTQVYKGVPATYCCGVTMQWTSIPSRGSSNTPVACFMLRKPR